MRQILYYIYLSLLLVLTGCSSPVMSTVLTLPTNTAVPALTETSIPSTVPTPTETSIPSTSTLEPTATATVSPTPAVPNYMQAFLDGGYDELSDENILFFVYNEDQVHYAPGDGIIFNERIIRSWVDVGYFEDGAYKEGIILGFVMRGGNGIHSGFGKFTFSSAGSSYVSKPSMEYLENTALDFATLTPETTHVIMYADLTIPNTGDAELYEGIFPVVAGKLQSVHIDGIGTVLPIGTACRVK